MDLREIQAYRVFQAPLVWMGSEVCRVVMGEMGCQDVKAMMEYQVDQVPRDLQAHQGLGVAFLAVAGVMWIRRVQWACQVPGVLRVLRVLLASPA